MEYRFDFDDQLPDLPIAFDFDEVAELFERKLFGPASPQDPAGVLSIKKLQDLKYRPSHRCVTTYEMIVGKSDRFPERTIGVLEFTPEGVLPRLYTADDRLPWLARAADMSEMQRLFSELPGYEGQIKLLEIFPVRYKPGLHCVIRYMVEIPSGKEMFYGKSFSGNAERLMKTITDLHHSSQENPDMPLISSPVAVWPEMEMILQAAVPDGIEFTHFAYDQAYDASVREDWMEKSGRALGVFHSNSTAPSETKTIYDDLRDLHEYTLIMAKVEPELATKYEEVIQQINTKVNHFKEPKAVASHGAMRTDQFILQGDRLAMIDLDSYCWANPARDLGNFLAYLCWKAIRQPEHAQFVERAGRAFLEGYLSVQKDIDEKWLSVYQAASLLKIAGHRFRSLTYLEWPLVIHLIQAAGLCLNEGPRTSLVAQRMGRNSEKQLKSGASDISPFIHQEQDAGISTGLQQFSELPGWLASAKDHDRTCKVLSKDIPEIADGSVILKKCRIGHMLLKDGVWQNRCILKVSIPDEPGERTIEFNGTLFPPGFLSIDQPVVEGVFGAEGWHAIFPELNLEVRTPEPETELESIGLLTDPEKSREFLERSLRGASPAYRSVHIQSCTPEIIRYKPGNRCTIRYHLEYAPDMPIDYHGPAIVMAKTYLQEKGRNAYESMKALWNASFGSGSSVRIAEPLAYDPDLRIFVQGPVWEEQTLADAFLSALDAGTPEAIGTLNEAMQKTAKGLADLHRSGVKIGQTVTWEEEIAEVQAQVIQLSTVFPNLSSGAAPFLERMGRLEPDALRDPLVPSHGTFRPVQVLLNKGEVSFIDFDSFCQSEPARDLAMFLSSIMILGLTLSSFDKGESSDQPIANLAKWEARFEQVSSICEQFLDAYQQFEPVSRQRVVLWQALDLFHYVLSGWMKVKVGEVSSLAKLLGRFLIASHLIDAK